MLPELTVGVVVAGIIAVAVMAFILISTRQWQTQEERVSTTDAARNGLHAMVAELRDAQAVTYVSSQRVDATVRTPTGGAEAVSYQCVGGTPTGSCSRITLSSGASRLLVEGVTEPNVFARVSASDVAGVDVADRTLSLSLSLDQERAQNPIVLASSVTPRNCSETPGVMNPPC